MLTELAPVDPVETLEDVRGDHPMRTVTREVAFDRKWDEQSRADVAALFNMLSTDWDETRSADARFTGLLDALERGEPNLGRGLELGPGTGTGTRRMASRFESLISLDLAPDMLAFVDPSLTQRVLGDSSNLPFPNGSIDCAVLMNMLLFPDEIDRILSPNGTLVWVNSSGANTPIYLSAADVLAALPGEWSGRASASGTSTWLVAHRTQDL